MSEVADEVLQAISKYGRVGLERLTPEAKLAELEIASLEVVEIVFALEEKFGIEIPLGDNQQQIPFETVGAVVAAVEGLVAAKNAA